MTHDPDVATRRRVRNGVIVATVIILNVAAFAVHALIRSSQRGQVRRVLGGIVDARVAAVDAYLDSEFRFASACGRYPPLVDAVERLVELRERQPAAFAVGTVAADGSDQSRTDTADRWSGGTPLDLAQRDVGDAVRMFASGLDDIRYSIWDRRLDLVAAPLADRSYLGVGPSDLGAVILSRALRGRNAVWLPSSEGFIVDAYELTGVYDRPRLALLVPVRRGSDGTPIGVLKLGGIGLQDRFDDMLDAGGESTGRTFAVGTTGRRVGGSMDAADPVVGGAAAQIARTRSDGIDIDGYRDASGRRVFGAWRWLDHYGFGVVTEIDQAAVMSPLAPLRRAAYGLLALTGLSAVLSLLRWRWTANRIDQLATASRVGAYRILRRVAGGGAGLIYQAEHVELGRPAAIKVMRKDRSDRGALTRFRREMRTLARLHHPSVVDIYDAGRTPRGGWYLAMEWIEGEDLRTRLDRDGRQPAARVRSWLIEILDGLHHAHRVGIIHRDIKPSNVMIDPDGRVRLLDFGLAKVAAPVQPSADRPRDATRIDVLVGTPLYIAPERIADPDRMDVRTDLYSVGVLAYTLLVGTEPFQTDPDRGTTRGGGDGRSRIRRLLSDSVPELGPGLSRLIESCLEFDPNDRPVSAEAAGAMLEPSAS